MNGDNVAQRLLASSTPILLVALFINDKPPSEFKRWGKNDSREKGIDPIVRELMAKIG